MTSEREIRRAIKPLLDRYGELNTSEIKQKLHEVLTYDKDDLVPSPTRNEIMILQRIGNIVAHQSDDVKHYPEGYVVDKRVKPAKFTAVVGLGEQLAPLSRGAVNKRKDRSRQFIGRSIDWGKKRERDEVIGNLGEEYVLEFEKDRVETFDPSSKDRVLHLSRQQGDGLGYDISSVNEDGTTRRIEVKTTTGDINQPFYMSRNEKLFFETYIDDGAFVYRVYNFNINSRKGDIEIISAEELLNSYDFDPVSFAVTKKNEETTI